MVATCGLLSACDAAVDSLSQTAESVRTSTEEMALSSRVASAEREALIMKQGADINRARQGELERAVTGTAPRFVIKSGPDGFAVYDNVNGGRASGGGLTRGQAEQTAANLRQQENDAARLQADTATIQRGRR